MLPVIKWSLIIESLCELVLTASHIRNYFTILSYLGVEKPAGSEATLLIEIWSIQTELIVVQVWSDVNKW